MQTARLARGDYVNTGRIRSAFCIGLVGLMNLATKGYAAEPTQETEYEAVRAQIVVSKNEIIGVRAYPGRDRQRFYCLGIEPGELVVAIDGVSLVSPIDKPLAVQKQRTFAEKIFNSRVIAVERQGKRTDVKPQC